MHPTRQASNPEWSAIASSERAASHARVAVIVPVVERHDDLERLLADLQAVLRPARVTAEILFVFDGGIGKPPQGLRSLAASSPDVTVLSYDRPLGETTALRAGIQATDADVLMTVPAYRQTEVSGVRWVLDAVLNGADLAIAYRSPRSDGWFNRLQSWAFRVLVNRLFHTSFRDVACGMRAMRSDVARDLPLYGDMHRFVPILALHRGYRIVEVPVPQDSADTRFRPRSVGIYLRRLLDLFGLFFVTRFTEKPLRFFGLAGGTTLIIGLLLTTILSLERLFGDQPLANRPLFLLGVLLMALGVQILGLGLVGEIIVHLRAPYRRGYRVRERI